jgi:pimeloyl-ACP methyl ester carboxylesterase
MKGPVKLQIYRRREGEPKAGDAPKPVVMLIHGSSLSALSTYDLGVPGEDYSMMNFLARAGYDVFTMDHENYGKSSRTSSNSDIASGAADLLAAVPVIQKESGATKIDFFGESAGAIRLGMYANNHPEAIRRLIFGGFTYTGKEAPTLIERAKKIDEYRASNVRKRDAAMIESIFTRDGKPSASPAAIAALVKQEMAYGDTAPTGTYIDMSVNLPLVDPAKITVPTMLIRGQIDQNSTFAELYDFWNKMPVADKQLIVVPGGHALASGIGYRHMWHAVDGFLTMPDTAVSL